MDISKLKFNSAEDLRNTLNFKHKVNNTGSWHKSLFFLFRKLVESQSEQ